MDLKNLKHKLSDKKWRMRNLYYIKDKEGKKTLFIPNEAQQNFEDNQHGLDIILKARQQGFTTYTIIDYLDDVLFTANLNAGIIAHTLEDAKSLFEEKVKFAYDNLPEIIKLTRPAKSDRAGELRFEHGSSIRVRTSFRSGTLQRLHVSEFGKICAKTPEKAREIVTGAFNAVQAGQKIRIESTAEGKVGYFFDYCDEAMKLERMGKELTLMDFKFHFFPWWKSKEYVIEDKHLIIPSHLDDYFKSLEKDHGIKLTHQQKAWYVKKEKVMGDDMGREFPSFADEAFAQSVEGSYYGNLISQAESEKRICKLPHEPALRVYTAWDLGMDDSMAIWFFQVGPGGERRYIDYYENSGEGLEHYVDVLDKRRYLYASHILPHDVRVRELGTGVSRLETLEKLGMRDIIIAPDIGLAEGINATRIILPRCYFDEAKCALGLELLKQYRKDWDEKAGCWKNKPLHDFTSHAADSFRMSAVVEIFNSYQPGQRRALNKYR